MTGQAGERARVDGVRFRALEQRLGEVVRLIRVNDGHGEASLGQGRRERDPIRPGGLHHDENLAGGVAGGEEPRLHGREALRGLIQGERAAGTRAKGHPDRRERGRGDVDASEETVDRGR